MARMKLVFAALLFAAIVGVVPQTQAQTVKVVSLRARLPLWQSLALAAYKSGTCVSGGTAPCFHYTAKNFNLTDGRPTTKGGSPPRSISAMCGSFGIALATANVWAFIKVDSGVGDRCYFLRSSHCNVNITTFPAPGNLITSTLWG